MNVDDKLRRPYIVERYVAFMERHPRAAFVFCPAMPLRDDEETGTAYGVHGHHDQLFNGPELLERLVYWNNIWVPSVMARRESYERAEYFPLDLPFSGDWYLWCHFALQGDVGYLAEPMVHYRLHDANMTNGYAARVELVIAQEAEVRWRIKRLAEAAGLDRLAQKCRAAIAGTYLTRTFGHPERATIERDAMIAFEALLQRYCSTESERAAMRALLEVARGDSLVERSDFADARRHYRRAIAYNTWESRAWAKYALSYLGRQGGPRW
jgi:hypothetical protein